MPVLVSRIAVRACALLTFARTRPLASQRRERRERSCEAAMKVVALRAILCVAMLGFWPASSRAAVPVLAINGDHFTVNGIGRFLLFVSYFHGLDRPTHVMEADLNWLRDRGVNGVRVWPNAGVTKLMNANGDLNQVALARLKLLVNAAASRGMIVDVTLNREGVCRPPDAPECGFTVSEYRNGIAAAAAALRGWRNLLFDLQNEWNVQSNLNTTQLASIRQATKDQHPTLITVASVSGGTYQNAATSAFDAVAYHGSRDSQGGWASLTTNDVNGLRGAIAQTVTRVAPIYLQEPNRFKYAFDSLPYYDDQPASYWTAAQNAKASGAAAWTFHTAASFNLDSNLALSALLKTGERDVLQQIAQRLNEASWGARTPTLNTRADYDGDGVTDLPLINLSTAQWSIRQSGGTVQNPYWFAPGDVVASADYTGDGKVDIAIYRPGTSGAFFVIRSDNGATLHQPWGTTGSTPVPADYDGDGIADVAVYHTDHQFHVLMSRTHSYLVQGWGTTGSTPVPADYDGDGNADFAVYHSDYRFYVLPSRSAAPYSVAWGTPGDVPVPADYDGDGKADLAIFRASESAWYIKPSGGENYAPLYWGSPNDRLVPGDYDGDGRADPAVYRPSEGRWFALLSSTEFTIGRWWAWGTPFESAARCSPALNGATC